MDMVAAESGFSRQAVYRHFGSRAGLLTALLEHIDVVEGAREAVDRVLAAPSGSACVERLFSWWAGYVPRFAGIARGVLAAKHADPDLRAAWDDRMRALRTVCAAVIDRCAADRTLAPGASTDEAVEILWALLSVPLWIQLTDDAGWTADRYARTMAATAVAALSTGAVGRDDRAEAAPSS
jgi:AcrR family transcriptional regulator